MCHQPLRGVVVEHGVSFMSVHEEDKKAG